MGFSHGLNGAHASATFDCVLNDFVRKQGGVTGVVNQFEKEGLGPTIRSWVGNGENHPISEAQIYRALGFVTLQQLGGQLRLSPDEVAAKLSKVLPCAVEKMSAEARRATTSNRSMCRYFTGSMN
jgi:uncharacterized protein YidB (DUF937 family)